MTVAWQTTNVVITGAAGGLGSALARALARQGAYVIVADRNEEELNNIYGAHTGRIHVLPLDLTRAESVCTAVERIKVPTIDMLINGAGVFKDPGTGLRTLDYTDFVQTFTVNSFGHLQLTRALLPFLLNAECARVINVSSAMGSIGSNQTGLSYAYRMSKSALNMFTKCLALEFPNLVVVSLHPGHVMTPMGGDRAKVPANRAAGDMLRLLAKLDRTQSGMFLDRHGSPIPW